jgi:hypothetical protein
LSALSPERLDEIERQAQHGACPIPTGRDELCELVRGYRTARDWRNRYHDAEAKIACRNELSARIVALERELAAAREVIWEERNGGHDDSHTGSTCPLCVALSAYDAARKGEG